MATVVNSSWGPCTDMARHCDMRIVYRADGYRFRTDIVVRG